MSPTSADCLAAIYESVAMVAGAFRGANHIGADVVATRESLRAFVNICCGTILSTHPKYTSVVSHMHYTKSSEGVSSHSIVTLMNTSNGIHEGI